MPDGVRGGSADPTLPLIAAKELDPSIGKLQRVLVNGGDGLAASDVGSAVPAATQAAQRGLWINGQYLISPDGGANWVPVPGDALGQFVQGPLAHDAPVGGSRPVRVAGKANDSTPALVAAGDVVDQWATRSGAIVTAAGGLTVAADGNTNAPTGVLDVAGVLRPLAEYPLLLDESTGQSSQERANSSGFTLLASAARTANTASPAQVNRNCRGMILRLLITLPGTGSLTLRIRHPAGSFTVFQFAAVTVTSSFNLYPGLGTGSVNNEAVSRALPREWDALVIHSDASSWTYQLLAAYIL